MELNFNKLNNISSEGLSQRETHADAYTSVLNKSTLCTTHLTENATERNTDAQKRFIFNYILQNNKREAGLISIYAQLRDRHINLIKAVFNNRCLFSEEEYASFTEDYDRCVDDFYNTFMLYHLQKIEKKDFSKRLKEKLKNNAFEKHIDEMLKAVDYELQNNTAKFINCCEYMIYRSIFPPVSVSDEEAEAKRKGIDSD